MIKIGEKKGDFLIKAEIGKGGMGTIYYATDTMLNRDIALKVIHPELANNNQLMERFKIEAMTQARMNHPNIVTIFSFSKIDDDNIIAMEYVEGKNLKDLLLEKRILSVEEALSILKQILKGLEYSHSRNVIHRDIKPANILITEDGKIKLSDFGIAKVFGKQGLTKTGMLLGTPWYTPPEQILGENIDFRSDLYSVGITFFEMVTGTVPFDSETNSDFQIQKAHLETPPPRPSIYNPEIGSRIEKFILKALQKKPEKRFQSATEMLKAVESLEKKVNETTQVRRGKTTLLEHRQIKTLSSESGKKKILISLISLIFVLGMSAIYFFLIKPSSKTTLTTALSQKNSISLKENNSDKQKDIPVSLDKKTDEKERIDNSFEKESEIQPQKNIKPDIPIKSSININKKTDTILKEKRIPINKDKNIISSKKTNNTNTVSDQEIKKNIPSEKIEEEKTISRQPDINIDLELINLRKTLNERNLKVAEQKINNLLQTGIKSSKLYSFAGKLNFFKKNFKKAEKFWNYTLKSNGSISLGFFHKHGIFNKGCSGQLILKKNLIIFDSITRPSHSLALTADRIKKVDKPKNSFGIRISYLSKGNVKKNIFILKGRNRKGEKFLTEFINKYVLEDK